MRAFVYYRALENILAASRVWHDGKENPLEDAIVDELDPLWWEMSDAERSVADSEDFDSLVAFHRKSLEDR